MKTEKLEKLFEKQKILQERFGNLPFRSMKHKQEFINLNCLACLDELSEAMRETAWKNPKYIRCGWKQTQPYNAEMFKEEIIDLWHFVINLSIASGMDAGEVYTRFINKNKENHKRQDDGY